MSKNGETENAVDWELIYLSLERIRALSGHSSFAEVIDIHCDNIANEVIKARDRYGIGGNDTLVYEWDATLRIDPKDTI